MATAPRSRAIVYPTSDGKPMAETDVHRGNMTDLIETLEDRFADDPMVYVSGNLLMFYEEGDKRKHLAPDVFVVFGVKKRRRDHYLIWEEGKGPDVVIEITSKTTREADQKKKFVLYRDVLKVPEYFLFDPLEDYLKPSTQGYRLRRRLYAPIGPVQGRFPSTGLGLHLERDGSALRLFDPASDRRLLTPREQAAQNLVNQQLAEAARLRSEAALLNADTRARLAEIESERLRREIEGLKRRLGPAGGD
jgi:Uma2 family endonuclease